jgi:hypothetical protein
MCDEVKELDWAVALTSLVELVEQIVLKSGKRITAWIQAQLLQWINSLPSYIKAYLPISIWSSRRKPHDSRPSQIRTCPIKAYGSSYHHL